MRACQAVAAITGAAPAHGQVEDARNIAQYTVTFDAARPGDVRVDLTWVPRTSSLVLEIEDAPLPGLPDGAAGFVHELRARTVNGAFVPLAREAPGRWRLDAKADDAVFVSYRARLEHSARNADGTPRYDWSRPVSELALALPDLAFATGRVLFLLPEDMTRAVVRARLPEHWHVVTSWERAGSEVSFRASRDELRAGMIAAGRLTVSRYAAGGIALTLATPLTLPAADRERVTRAATTSLGRYTRVLGGMPRSALGRPYRGVTLLVAEAPAAALAGGGLAWKDVVLLLPPGPESWNRQALVSVAAELFELWSGRAFRHRTARDAWFTEGSTTYYALRVLLAEGLLTANDYRDLMDAAFDRYRQDPWIGGNSILRAGAERDAHRALVVDGGLLVVACIDADLRRATDGAKAIDDLTRAMFRRFDAGARMYDTAALFELVGELAGDATARRLERMVEGTASLGLWRCATEVPSSPSPPSR